jgi:REP element-mobilizing transposase RayT
MQELSFPHFLLFRRYGRARAAGSAAGALRDNRIREARRVMADSTTDLVFAVTVATSGGAAVFDEIPFGLACLSLLREVCRQADVRIHAWCLMPDHACLLLGAGRRETLAAAVTAWKSLCARKGGGQRLWQRGFSDRSIGSAEAAWLAARYIIEKPVRAGLVGDAREYPLCGQIGPET